MAAVAPDYEPVGFSHERGQALIEIDERHFWFGPRERLVSRIISRLVPDRVTAAIELGCGSGRMLKTLAKYADEVVGIDGHAALLERAADRAHGATLIHSDVAKTPLESHQFELLMALDVLEHVEPAAFLSEALRLSKPRGTLVLSVPAFDFLWSEADATAGHRCRYTPATLRSELRANGWTPIGHTFYQTLLFPLMILTRRVAPRRLRNAERCPPKLIAGLLGRVNSFEVELSSRWAMPFGSSLIAWARN